MFAFRSEPDAPNDPARAYVLYEHGRMPLNCTMMISKHMHDPQPSHDLHAHPCILCRAAVPQPAQTCGFVCLCIKVDFVRSLSFVIAVVLGYRLATQWASRT